MNRPAYRALAESIVDLVERAVRGCDTKERDAVRADLAALLAEHGLELGQGAGGAPVFRTRARA